MVEGKENAEPQAQLPTEDILRHLKGQMGAGKAVKLDHGASNTVAAVYVVRVSKRDYIVKTYRPIMREGEPIGNAELASNMRASVRFHREFFGLAPFMVDTDLAVADIGDGTGERVCVIQERANGRKMEDHLTRISEPVLTGAFSSAWGYLAKDNHLRRSERLETSGTMLGLYARKWARRMKGGRPDEELVRKVQERILVAIRNLDQVFSTFLDGLSRLISMSAEEREKLYGQYGLTFAMRSSPDRGSEPVSPGTALLLPDLFRRRNAMVDAREGRISLFDVSDLREFQDLPTLLDHYVTGLRQMFLLHFNPAQARRAANGSLTGKGKPPHPRSWGVEIDQILGEYSILLPWLPETEKRLMPIIAGYKSKKTAAARRSQVARTMRASSSGD